MSESPTPVTPTAEGQPGVAGRRVQGQSTAPGPTGQIVAGRNVEAQPANAGRAVEGQATGANRHPSRPTEGSEGGPRRHPRTGRFS